MKTAVKTLIVFIATILQLSVALAQGLGESRQAPHPKKIVIFYASVGAGHESASKAIMVEAQKIDPTAVVVMKDVREFMNQSRNKMGKWAYDMATKVFPDYYDKWFKGYMAQSETVKSIGDMPLVPAYNPKGILEFLKHEKPDAIVSTFMHCTEALIHLRDKGELLNTPISQVLTDYVDSHYFIRLAERLEMTFVPHEAIRASWLKQGFPSSKVATIGMPVTPLAFDKMTLEQRNAFLISKGLDPNIPTITLVSGSAGVGDFAAVVKSIAKEFGDRPVQILAVCGKNESNFAALAFLRPKLPKNIVLKVGMKIPQADLLGYVKSSDVVITKSGGLSISEFATIGRPLVLLNINGGQEDFNSNLFGDEGMALVTKKESGAGKLVKELVDNKPAASKMLIAQSKYVGMINQKAAANWVLHPSMPQGPPPVKAKVGSKAFFVYDNRDVISARLFFTEAEAKSTKPGKGIDAIYYMMDGNKVGAATLAEYRKAALAGAPVRLILDGWAPERWLDAKFDPAMLKAAVEDGVQIKIFNPVDLSKLSTKIKISTYKRTHDKMQFNKSIQVMSLGDRNVQNVNFAVRNHNEDAKEYRSTEMFFEGDIYNDGQAYFEEVWNSSKVKAPTFEGVTDAQVDAARKNLNRYNAAVEKMKATGVFVDKNWFNEMEPIEEAEFFHDNPELKGKVAGSEDGVIKFIDGVQKELILISPYILLTPKVKKAVLRAMDERGVQLIVYTASPSATDVKAASLAFEMQAASELLPRGAIVLQHQGPQLMHAKFMIGDRTKLAQITHNIDGISEYINLESGVSFKSQKLYASVSQFVEVIKSESKPFITPTEQNTWGKAKTCTMLFINQVWPSLPKAIR